MHLLINYLAVAKMKAMQPFILVDVLKSAHTILGDGELPAKATYTMTCKAQLDGYVIKASHNDWVYNNKESYHILYSEK